LTLAPDIAFTEGERSLRLSPSLGECMSEIWVLKAHKANKILPPGYSVDHDPDVAVLRRADGSVVAYFPMWTFQPIRALDKAEADLARTERSLKRRPLRYRGSDG
jgi:hypothetical protein